MTESYNSSDNAHMFIIDETQTGIRLDKTLNTLIDDLSRVRLQNLIKNGDVFVNKMVVISPSYKLKMGDVITVDIPPPVDWYPEPEAMSLDVVYEDADLLVINKPAGLVVHPGAGHSTGTLVHGLLHHCGESLSGIGGVLRPGIVHRLDKDTSGLMVVAKNDRTHQGLSTQFADRTLSRRYKALVMGVPMPPKGSIDHPIGRHHTNRIKMAVNGKHGKPATTHYRVIDRFCDTLSLVECALETGRTHQIRVHMHHIKHPLIGDQTYGPQKTALRSALKKAGYDHDVVDRASSFPRQALHAWALSFVHPIRERTMNFERDVPEDMRDIMDCFA